MPTYIITMLFQLQLMSLVWKLILVLVYFVHIFEFLGSPCSVTSFDDTDKLKTKIVCQTNAAQSTKSEYIGNRGVNLIRDNVLTSFASLGSSKKSLEIKI